MFQKIVPLPPLLKGGRGDLQSTNFSENLKHAMIFNILLRGRECILRVAELFVRDYTPDEFTARNIHSGMEACTP